MWEHEPRAILADRRSGMRRQTHRTPARETTRALPAATGGRIVVTMTLRSFGGKIRNEKRAGRNLWQGPYDSGPNPLMSQEALVEFTPRAQSRHPVLGVA